MNCLNDKYGLLKGLFFSSVAVLLIFCSDAFAAGEISSGRKLWNNIMLVVNFGILVFLFLKYARKPLINFLKGIIKKTEDQLNALSGKFEEVRSIKEEEESRLSAIEDRIKEIQDRIIEIGKNEKEKAIEQGKMAAAQMIEDAKQYAGYRMAKAKKKFSDEMVDLAIEIVKERLIENISDEDEQKLTTQFISNLDTAKKHVS